MNGENPMRKSVINDQRRVGEVDPNDLTVCTMCCCSYFSFYLTMPDCLGCFINSHCCCIESTMVCCKKHPHPDKICICMGGDTCIFVYPTTCSKLVWQCCCFDKRCAIPCDKDVPCGLGICFLTVCVDYEFVCGCCSTLGALRARGRK